MSSRRFLDQAFPASGGEVAADDILIELEELITALHKNNANNYARNTEISGKSGYAVRTRVTLKFLFGRRRKA